MSKFVRKLPDVNCSMPICFYKAGHLVLGCVAWRNRIMPLESKKKNADRLRVFTVEFVAIVI